MFVSVRSAAGGNNSHFALIFNFTNNNGKRNSKCLHKWLTSIYCYLLNWKSINCPSSPTWNSLLISLTLQFQYNAYYRYAVLGTHTRMWNCLHHIQVLHLNQSDKFQTIQEKKKILNIKCHVLSHFLTFCHFRFKVCNAMMTKTVDLMMDKSVDVYAVFFV